MDSVAGQKHVALGVSLSNDTAPGPDARSEPFGLDTAAPKGSLQIGFAIDRLRRQTFISIEHHHIALTGSITRTFDQTPLRPAPGDMLEVRIHKLELRVPYGVNNSGP